MGFDAGWMGLYLLAYLPTLFLARAGMEDRMMNAGGRIEAGGLATLPDVLSQMLEGGAFQGGAAGQLRLAAPWGIQVPGGAACFCCLLKGPCRIELDDGETAAVLEPGDVALTTRQAGHVLAMRPAVRSLRPTCFP